MTQTMIKEIRNFDDFCKLVKEINAKMERVIVRLEDAQCIEITPYKLEKAGKMMFRSISEEDHVQAVVTMDKIQARLDRTKPHYNTVEEAMEHARRRGYSAH